MLCKHCGAPLLDDDLFCGECGQPVVAEAQPVIPQPYVGASPVAPQAYDPYAGAAPVAPQAYDPYATAQPVYPDPYAGVSAAPVQPPKKKKRTGLIVTAIITAVAVLIGGVASWFFVWGPYAKVTVYAITGYWAYDENGVNTYYVAYEYNDRGMILSEKSDSGEYEYDSSQNYWEEVNQEADGVFDNIRECSYDDNGMTTGSSYYSYSGNPYEYSYEYEYEYSGKKQLDTIYSYYSNEDSERETTYTLDYDSDGRLTEVYRKNEDGRKIYLEVSYDDEGRVEEVIDHSYYSNRVCYSYDSEGRLDEIKDYGKSEDDGKWKIYRTISYSYDEKGNLTEVKSVDADGDKGNCKIKYDSKGNLLSATYLEDGEKQSVFEFTYKGRKVTDGKRKVYYEDGNNAELTYDKNGNLIEVEYDDGSHFKMEYTKLRLSKQDAARYYENQSMESDVTGIYVPSYNFMDLVALPVDPAQELSIYHR